MFGVAEPLPSVWEADKGSNQEDADVQETDKDLNKGYADGQVKFRVDVKEEHEAFCPLRRLDKTASASTAGAAPLRQRWDGCPVAC